MPVGEGTVVICNVWDYPDMMFLVEDLHWMDRTSQEFLSYFMESMPGASILLLLLYRPDYTPAWTSRSLYSQVRVESLPERSSAELIEAILSAGKVSPNLSDFITAKAAGNLLFIEDLTRSLLESGAIVKEGESYALSTEPSEVKVPATVQGIIASRLDRLPGDEKETLQVAAVIGREFSPTGSPAPGKPWRASARYRSTFAIPCRGV